MKTKPTASNRYRNARGYTAYARAVCEGRVLYDAYDADGAPIQNNGCA